MTNSIIFNVQEMIRSFWIWLLPFVVLLLALNSCRQQGSPAQTEKYERFSKAVGRLAGDLGITKLTFRIVQHDKVFYTADLGDGQNNNSSGGSYTVPLGDLFATMMALQLIQEKKISLDTRAVDAGLKMLSDVTVRNLLTHTSDFPAGNRFMYSDANFDAIRSVIENKTQADFNDLALERIIERYDLQNTAYFADTACCSTDVSDMAALVTHDEHSSEASNEFVYKAVYLRNGRNIPFGLGWFVEVMDETKVSWTYGTAETGAFFIARILPQDITLVFLSNSPNLNEPFPLNKGSILESKLGLLIVKYFIYNKMSLPEIDYRDAKESIVLLDSMARTEFRDLYLKDLASEINMKKYLSPADVSALEDVYERVFPFDVPVEYLKTVPIAEINLVHDQSDISETFVLKNDEDIRVFGVGEFLYDYIQHPTQEDNVSIYISAVGEAAKTVTFIYGNRAVFGDLDSFKGIDFRFVDTGPDHYQTEVKLPWSVMGVKSVSAGSEVDMEIAVTDKSGKMKPGRRTLSGQQTDISDSAMKLTRLVLAYGKQIPDTTDNMVAFYADEAPIIDGLDDAVWSRSDRYQIKGSEAAAVRAVPDVAKVLWDSTNLYVLVQISDHSKTTVPSLFVNGDFGWIVDHSTGNVQWSMEAKNTKYAGGAFKNRYIDTTLRLKAGEYILRYTSDESGSYGNWNDNRPESSVYGIVLFRKMQPPL